MQSEERQGTLDAVGQAGPSVIPLTSTTHIAIDQAHPSNGLETVGEQCLLASIADHPSGGGYTADVDEPAGLVLVEPVRQDESSEIPNIHAPLAQSTVDELDALENEVQLAHAETDPAVLRRRALDVLLRSEEEAHGIIETAQRDAASRTTRAELKAKLTLEQARERADLLLSSAQARSELLAEEAWHAAVADAQAEARQESERVVAEAKVEAKAKLQFAASEGRQIIDRARRQADEIVQAAELAADERRLAAADMYSAIETLERRVEQDAVIAAEASAQAAADVLEQAEVEVTAMRHAAALLQQEARDQAEVVLHNAHSQSEQIIAGADETAAWFDERVHAREAAVREAAEAHMNDMLERAEAASLELLLNARERSNEMIIQAQFAVDRMMAEGQRSAQDLVSAARSDAAAHGGQGGDADAWFQPVDDAALNDLLAQDAVPAVDVSTPAYSAAPTIIAP